MKYPVTFYNAIWLILFAFLVSDWSWWLFAGLFMFCPAWNHLRQWYDDRRYIKNKIDEHLRELNASPDNGADVG